MVIIHRFVFNSDLLNCLTDYCDLNITYDKMSGLYILEMSENDNCYSEVSRIMKTQGVLESIYERFSDSELEQAEWLYIRSTWRCAYPEPRDNFKYLCTTYNMDSNALKNSKGLLCKCHLQQKAPFTLKKTPDWKTRGFTMLYCVEDEIFISDTVKQILDESQLQGLDYEYVLNRHGDVLSNIHQIIINNCADFGVYEKEVQRYSICPYCGCKKLILKPGLLSINKNSFRNIESDIVKTSEHFGEITGSRRILISHKFFMTIKNNRIGKNLVFQPIELI